MLIDICEVITDASVIIYWEVMAVTLVQAQRDCHLYFINQVDST